LRNAAPANHPSSRQIETAPISVNMLPVSRMSKKASMRANMSLMR